MNADQINATRYTLSILQETHNSAEIQSERTQIVVTVRAKNETQEAANILGATLICYLGSSLTKAFLFRTHCERVNTHMSWCHDEIDGFSEQESRFSLTDSLVEENVFTTES